MIVPLVRLSLVYLERFRARRGIPNRLFLLVRPILQVRYFLVTRAELATPADLSPNAIAFWVSLSLQSASRELQG